MKDLRRERTGNNGTLPSLKLKAESEKWKACHTEKVGLPDRLNV